MATTHKPGRVLRQILILGVGLLVSCSLKGTGAEVPVVREGVIDLSSRRYETLEKVYLKGDWEFHWKRLLEPGETVSGPKSFIAVPGMWSDHKIEGRPAGGMGFATYRVKIIVPEAGREYAILVPKIFTAYRLWADDRRIAERGVVGTDEKSSQPVFLPRLALITPSANEISMTLQISNFHHPEGGMRHSISIGTADDMIRSRTYAIALDMLAFGGLIIIGLYHLGLFFLRRKDHASLFFALFCLITALRILMEEDRVLIDLLPVISWSVNEVVVYLTYFFMVITGSLYLQRLLPDEYPRSLVNVCVGIGLAFCAFVIITPVTFFAYTLIPYTVNTLLWLAVALLAIIRAALRRREGARFLLAGMLVLAAASVNDLLYFNSWSHTGGVVQFGLLFFAFSQAVLLSLRFSRAYSRVETLSMEKSRLFSDAIEIISSLILESSARLYEKTVNVTRIAVMMARKAGMTPPETEDVRIAALLHDLGMIGAGKRNIAGGARFDEGEKSMMENHPLRSMEIIKSLKELSKVMLIISQHHERFDGTGYPLKLKGREIHLGARIIGLADDFVEMLSRREYQTVDKKGKIIEALVKMKGTVHDPQLVDDLIRLIDSEKLIYDIREEDILVRTIDGLTEWRIPSNKYFETIVVDRVIREINARVPLDQDLAFALDFSLCEVVRNAITHGNKYDETKRVIITLEH